MNSVLLRDVKEHSPNMEVDFYHSPDYRIIALINHQKPENKFKFHQDGRIRHNEFVAELRDRGYEIPAKYSVEWNSGANAWVGMLEEVPELKNPRGVVKDALMKNSAKRRRPKDV